MREPERYFYHSFPRRFREDPASEIDSGLQILSSIIASGFLLTPETTEWRESLSDGSLGKAWKVCQKTCSFTELASRELQDHSEEFGKFSIEFDLQAFRELGGLPVFYLPRATADDHGLESIAATLMARIGETQTLLEQLAELEKLVSANEDKSQLLVITNDVQQGYTRCSLGGAEDVLKYLTHGKQPVGSLSNSLAGLSALFYPAENFQYTGLLAYYRQREWRLVSNIIQHGQSVDRDLTAPEKAALMAIDSEFFGQEMEFRTGTCHRVDECRLFNKLNGKPLIQYANRVIVPGDALARAEELLEGSAEIQVVALEGLINTRGAAGGREITEV